jgi:hypothetical protein
MTPQASDVERLLAAARAAVAEGRALEAIDELSEPARRSADARLAAGLVELRHAAFRELPTAPGRPSWPLELADPFPDERGLPEIEASKLSCAVLGGAVVTHGALRVNGLVSRTTADALRDAIERSFEARTRTARGEAEDEGSQWFVPFAPGRAKAEGFGRDGFVRVVDAPRIMLDLVDIFTTTGVRSAVTEYFNERPAMIANKWVLRRTPTGKAGPDLHQDGAFLGEGIRTIDCWIALSDCGPGTGRPGIDLVPRRFDRVVPGGGEAEFPWSLPEELALEVAGDAEIVSPTFAAGDALFFDERLPHRTTVGTELTTRYAIESWFVAPSSYPDKHVPVVL